MPGPKPSYKPLWQEAQAEVKRLQDEVERTRKVIDLAGIARHMKVDRYTPQQWRQRDYLPPVDFPEIKEPLWYASTIRDKFAYPTRRMWYDDPDEAEEGVSPDA